MLAFSLPIRGVVGVLGGDRDELERQLRELEDPPAPVCDAVEVRLDLFESHAVGLDAVPRVSSRFPTLVTVRLPAHGGRFQGSEAERITLYERALASGASAVDVEWDSEAASWLLQAGAPVVVSFHDFDSMPEEAALEAIAAQMAEPGPLAIKGVPTALGIEDSVAMLRWVSRGPASEVPRIGFAMGPKGLPSRVLSLAWGAPWTYAALGAAVAPGIPTARRLKRRFRAADLGSTTSILAVVGPRAASSPSVDVLNEAFASEELPAVCLPFEVERLERIRGVLDALPISGICVEQGMEADAVEVADRADERARASRGAAYLRVGADRALEAVGAGGESGEPLTGDPAGPGAALARRVRDFGSFCRFLDREPSREAFERFQAASAEIDGDAGRFPGAF